MSSQCDLAAPYCEDSHCAEMCESDASCPGFEKMNQPFCVSGACVQCRETADCGDRVCVDGACTGCATDGECASGVCVVSTGLCAESTDVAFVSATGSPTSNCTKASPCTLLRALALDPPRPSIKMANGVYQNASTLTIEGKRTFSGEGSETTRITNAGTGPVFELGVGADVAFDRLEVFGAKNGAQAGVGLRCSGATKLRITDVRVAMNASDGIDAQCELNVSQSVFTLNGGFGARLTGASTTGYTIERSTVSRNSGGGIKATGKGLIQNTFTVNNMGGNLELAQAGGGITATRPTVNFVTSAKNFNNGSVISCTAFGGAIPVTNVVLHGLIDNGAFPPSCSISTCVTRDMTNEPNCTAFSTLFFVDEPNDDYHLPVGAISPAINGAAGGTGMLDYDGETRPKGAAADIGADEAF